MAKIVQENVLKTLRNGGLVVFPTDTVYGLLVDANNAAAVEKLIAFKARPPGKPISVFVSGFDMIEEVVELDEGARERLKQILPGPYTVVLKSKHTVSGLLESETGTLGVRFPKYEAVNELVTRFAGPVTATSANRSGYPSVHSVQALMNQLNETQRAMIDLVVDVGTLPPNKPSTVIDLTGENLKVLREGDFKFSSSRTYKSSSPEETADIARKIMKEHVSGTEGSVTLILEGDLGAGKTQFVKGVADSLEIADTIISPTFVIYYEYPIKESRFKNLIHMDLYNIMDAEEFKQLGIEQYFKKTNLFCIEWGEKAGEIIEELKKNTRLIYIHIKHTSEKTREISLKLTS